MTKINKFTTKVVKGNWDSNIYIMNGGGMGKRGMQWRGIWLIISKKIYGWLRVIGGRLACASPLCTWCTQVILPSRASHACVYLRKHARPCKQLPRLPLALPSNSSRLGSPRRCARFLRTDRTTKDFLQLQVGLRSTSGPSRGAVDFYQKVTIVKKGSTGVSLTG